jgi:thymidylate synthase (FAD)
MKIIKQSWAFFDIPDSEEILSEIELAGRTCYKSENKITSDSATDFVKRMIKSGHYAMIEFGNIPPVKVITDRGVTHEIVRHRLFSYAQESTRYCNYSKDIFCNEITFILPVWFYDVYEHQEELHLIPEGIQYMKWKNACKCSEAFYMDLIEQGQTPEEARTVLNNSLKTEICMKGNAREWRHFFTLRCSERAHPQMRELARDMLKGFRKRIPVLFDDIEY